MMKPLPGTGGGGRPVLIRASEKAVCPKGSIKDHYISKDGELCHLADKT